MDPGKLNISVAILCVWVANVILLLVFSLLFKGNIDLGTLNLPKPLASVFSGGLITAFLFFARLVIEKSDFKIKKDNWWIGVYFIANVVGIWIVKRLAFITGLGISNNLYVVLVALVCAAFEWSVLKKVKALLK